MSRPNRQDRGPEGHLRPAERRRGRRPRSMSDATLVRCLVGDTGANGTSPAARLGRFGLAGLAHQPACVDLSLRVSRQCLDSCG